MGIRGLAKVIICGRPNPTTEEILTDAPVAAAEDVDSAVRAAKDSQARWAKSSWVERANVLTELAQRVLLHAEELATLDALDAGIPVTGMQKDVANAVGFLRYFAALASERKGISVEVPGDGINYTIQEPDGVVGRIVPFNHPLQFAAQAVAAPLATGNAVILKPADQTPLSSLKFTELAQDVIPDDLLSVLTGNAGSALVKPRIGFTGSASTGRMVLRDAAGNIKAVSLELGGKNPLVVFPDVEADHVARACITAMNFTRSQGQSCGSPSRVFVHTDTYDEFVVLPHEIYQTRK